MTCWVVDMFFVYYNIRMFSDPLKNLKTLELKENDIVADLGAGTGFYSVLLGSLVPKGKVYAIEIVKDFLDIISKKIKDAHLSNVEVIWGDVEKIGGTHIKDNILNAVVVSNVFFQLENKENCVEEIKRILKNKGRVLFIDWSSDSSIINLNKKVNSKQIKEIFEKHGFIYDRNINTGAHHYGIIFIKN